MAKNKSEDLKQMVPTTCAEFYFAQKILSWEKCIYRFCLIGQLATYEGNYLMTMTIWIPIYILHTIQYS